ncbi:MAG: NUDIX hydrolase [Acidimicrobiales bacterium]|nr:NUDIX hydrolase [Acidimicrobiales bacterium]
MTSTGYQHAPTDDPQSVPIRDAATVLVVRDAPKLQVLMLQRGSRLAFGPQAWVFPGGRVDSDDAHHGDRVGRGLSDAQASALLDVPADGLAWWFAACRETLEEAGLLLGDTGTTHDVVERLRAVAADDPGRFVETLEAEGVTLDLTSLHEIARFTTPVGPPRRFDTRFFLAAAPEGQVATHDQGETVDLAWIEPAEAIARWRAEQMPIMPVTVRMLSCLARFETAAEALSVAASRPATQKVRIADPDGEYRVLMPGESGYDEAEIQIDHGWVRLWKT